MTRKIRWGILSTANIGRKVIPAMQASSNGEVFAVASRNFESAKAFAADLKIPKAYGSYEELINDPEVDAIYNPLPNSMHAKWSIACAEAGKPVLCEKPLASDVAESQSIVDAFARLNVPIAEAFMYRFHPQSQKARQMVRDGAVGDLQLIESSFTFLLTNEANIRLSKTLAGGALMDVGCYCLNVMRFITGDEPIGMKAQAHFGELSGVDEVLVGTLEFPSGVLGHFDCSLRAARKHAYDIRGTDGRILVEEGFTMPKDRATVIRYWHGDKYEEIEIPAADSYQIMAEDFADALLNNRPPTFPITDGVQNMQVIEALLADARA